MDPQLKSILTSVGMTLATTIAGAAVTHGYIHAQDQSAVADALVTAAGAAVTALLVWYKSRQASPAGLVQSIGNTEPKKVAAAVDAAPVAQQAAMVAVANESKVLPSGPINGGDKK